MSTKFAENTNELLLGLWDARGRANYVSLEDKQRRHLDEAMEMEPTFHKHFHFLEFSRISICPLVVTREGQKGNRFDRQEVHILSGSLIMLVSREGESCGEKEGKSSLQGSSLFLPKYCFFACPPFCSGEAK